MKAVFFDFDGTLTYTSLNFWKKIWSSLGYSIKDGSYYRQLFLSAQSGKISHQKWCDLCCDKFMEAGLDIATLNELAGTIYLMDGFDETMQELKKRGYTLFIVSGNIRQVIDYVLGEKAQYFDGIYANDFLFDKNGYLCKIKGTKYDNEGKADLISMISRYADIPLNDIYFVGNGGNDEWVYTTGCKTVLINPYDTKKHDNNTVWHHALKKVTNLTDILKVIN